MSEAIQAWIKQAAANPAVSGCGVRDADRALHVKSYRDGLPEEQITQAMRILAEALHALQQTHIYATRLCWTFEAGQIYCAAGLGGVMAVLVVTKEAADRPEIERLLASCPLTAD